MDALGTQLARHALGQRAKAELADGEGGEVGAAAQRSSGAGEEDRARPAGQHGPGGGASDEKAAEAAGAPAGFDLGGRKLDHGLAYIAAGVEDDEARRAEIAAGRREQV